MILLKLTNYCYEFLCVRRWYPDCQLLHDSNHSYAHKCDSNACYRVASILIRNIIFSVPTVARQGLGLWRFWHNGLGVWVSWRVYHRQYHNQHRHHLYCWSVLFLRSFMHAIGALIIGIGFWAPLMCNNNKEP